MAYVFSIYLFCLILGLHIAHCETCNDGEFLDEGTGCMQCPEHCLFCDSYEYCLSCENEYWGAKCEKKCHNCKSGTSCEKTNGFCLDGCSDGRTGVLCDTQCDEKCFSCNRTNSKHCLTCAYNRYSLNCDNICPSSCSNETCNHDTGVCTLGCRVGLWGAMCEHKCPDHCVNKVCLRENGTCINRSLEEGLLPSYVIYVTVIVIVVGQIVVAIIGGVICHRRQKRRKQDSSGSSKAESKNLLQVTYDKRKETVSEDASSSRPTHLNARDKSTWTLVKSVVDKFKTHQADQEQSKSRQQRFEDISGRLKTKNEAKIRQEFSSLPKDVNQFCLESQQARNKKTLEEMNICPYDFNEVVVTDDVGKHYYMNASYIKDIRKNCFAFIACIAPNEEYLDWDILFWRMVWLEYCSAIVMLNPLEEKGKKLPQYWPDKDKTERFGLLQVKCVEEHVDDMLGCLSRTFEIREEKTPGIVTVKQFQYRGWMEGDAAGNVSNLLEFRNIVNQAKKTNSGPIVVHSRKGVGRTGTYIALDLLLQTFEHMDDFKDETAVDIFSCVANLRVQRVNMVETEEQYKFLYDALTYYLDSKSRK